MPVVPSIPWDGKQISKPGIYSRMPLHSYHLGNICVGPSVSSSGFRALNPLSDGTNSPAHYWAYSPLNPKRRPKEDKPHFVLGRALHHLILGEPAFAKLFVERPDTVDGYAYNANRNEWKRWLAARRSDGKTVLSPEQIEDIRGMSLALGANHEVQQGILSGQIERSMFWIDDETGLWVKCRPDSIPADLQFGDLKITGTSVRWYDMQKSIEKFGYYQQAALVAEGCRRIFAEDMQLFTYVFIESKYPHCVDTVEIKDNDLARGHEVNHVAMRLIAQGLKTGKWPGPGERGIRPIEMRDHAQKIVDEFIKYGERYE